VESHDFRRLLNVDATTLSRRTMTLSNAVIAQWGGIKPRPVNGTGALLAAKTSCAAQKLFNLLRYSPAKIQACAGYVPSIPQCGTLVALDAKAELHGSLSSVKTLLQALLDEEQAKLASLAKAEKPSRSI
jgi:hypothetical protein